MAYSDVVQTISEVAAALAGFTAVLVAVRRGEHWSKSEVVGLVHFLQLSIGVVLLAVVAPTACPAATAGGSGVGVADASHWRGKYRPELLGRDWRVAGRTHIRVPVWLNLVARDGVVKFRPHHLQHGPKELRVTSGRGDRLPLRRHQQHPDHCTCMLHRLVRRRGQFHATTLAATTGMNLRFYDP